MVPMSKFLISSHGRSQPIAVQNQTKAFSLNKWRSTVQMTKMNYREFTGTIGQATSHPTPNTRPHPVLSTTNWYFLQPTGTLYNQRLNRVLPQLRTWGVAYGAFNNGNGEINFENLCWKERESSPIFEMTYKPLHNWWNQLFQNQDTRQIWRNSLNRRHKCQFPNFPDVFFSPRELPGNPRFMGLWKDPVLEGNQRERDNHGSMNHGSIT